MKTTDLIIAGLPRSGSTMTCHLLNKVPNVVALHEPMNPFAISLQEPKDIVVEFKAFFEHQRKSILENGFAKCKTTDGVIPTNSMGEFDAKSGRRIKLLNSDELKVDKPLDNNFLLAIKDPNFCAANLPWLKDHFQCFAIVRNPLSVLLSWNSVDMPCSDGYAPAAELYDKKLANLLRGEPDKFSRQIYLLMWHFEQYISHVDPQNIIQYENVIASGGKALRVVHPNAEILNEPLHSKNNNHLYDAALKSMLADKLLAVGDAPFWRFYTNKQILGLLE